MTNFWEKTFIDPVRNILKLDRKERSVPIDDTWKQINEMYEQENTNEIISRRREISESNIGNYYTGDLMGMSVFEGEVGIMDTRKTTKISPVKVRVILSREFDLPESANPQHVHANSRRNNNLLAALYFNAQRYLIGDYAGVFTNNNELKENDGVQLLAEMIDQYDELNSESSYPLTIVLAHGHVDESGQHLLNSGKTEVYPTRIFLDNLIKMFPMDTPTDNNKIPVMLTSCNEDNGRLSTISHPNVFLGYRKGTSAGFFKITGSTVISK